jgi:hypothetical protein
MHTKYWSENLKGREHMEGVGIDRRIILNWILEKQVVTVRTGLI